MRRTMRVYPIGCTSAYCGKIYCGGCRRASILNEFKDWVRRTGARVTDEIWNPLVYTIPEKQDGTDLSEA